jgi:Lysyl oxidase
MEQFAQYSLLNADETEAVRSQKQSFCLAPTDAIDLTIPTADWNPPFYGQDALSTVCGGGGAIWIREVLPVGWGDTYYQYVAGQSFDITHLPNGKYWVQVTANPTGLMVETTMDNNVSLRRVILRGTRGHRRVIVPPYLGLDG